VLWTYVTVILGFPARSHILKEGGKTSLTSPSKRVRRERNGDGAAGRGREKQLR